MKPCRCWGLNRGSMVSEATALPTEQPPLPHLLFTIKASWSGAETLFYSEGDWRQEKQWRGEQDLDGLVFSFSKSTRPITTRSPLDRLRVTLMIYVSGEIIWQHRIETKPTWWICWSRQPDNWSMWPPGFGLVREIFVSSRCRGKFGINSDFRSSFNEITSARKIDAPVLTIDIVGALTVTSRPARLPDAGEVEGLKLAYFFFSQDAVVLNCVV